LQYARDPQRNLILSHGNNMQLAILKRDASAGGNEALPAEVVKKLESEALALAFEQISAPRRRAAKKTLSEQSGS